MKIILIRHYQTPGNLQGRYIGVTDEDLALRQLPVGFKRYPRAEIVYTSPLKRCRQTAELIYPGQTHFMKENFKECDFGRFENKNYKELASDPAYQQWIDSNGTMCFPEGEDPMGFRARCKDAFFEVIDQCIDLRIKAVAMVVHGGTIMSIMEAYDGRHLGFYDYQVKNGDGYVLDLDEYTWRGGGHHIMVCRKRILE